MSPGYRYAIALAAASACRNRELIMRLKAALNNQAEAQSVLLAASRMGMTNPYFQARMVADIPAGGSLESLALRPLAQTGVADETAYHYYCIAISTINNGMPCFRSHLMALFNGGESPAAVDQALRITAAIHSLDQVMAWA
ncbi:hypothetical protein [Marinobacterium jannaschii]|uniref:hypothetical protein n=1 Tax=Marinobacterium jannaschii TaxID=64970 RepID=UPI000483BE4C|nr:hypothetical protein [Marinobacterium jannaschii]